MKYQLPKLKYEINDLAPIISGETMEFHYGRHHRTYIEKLNELIKGTKFERTDLEHLLFEAQGPLLNNAAQAWNHSFYWNCLSAKSDQANLSEHMKELLRRDFGSLENFQREFVNKALAIFGSGWMWLVKDQSGTMTLQATCNAENPVQTGFIPLLACDVWEHAYYIDYRNSRSKYLDGFWKIINWSYVEKCFVQASVEYLSKEMLIT